MAKCPLCGQRKGKRKCQAFEAFICSPCCGTNRNHEQCRGCLYFFDVPKRNYKDIPRYSTQEMADSSELEQRASVIEAALALIDQNQGLRDENIKSLLERLFDTYHFQDQEILFDSDQDREHYQTLSSNIETKLKKIPNEEKVKILAAIYKSLNRRTKGNREYLNFIHRFF